MLEKNIKAYEISELDSDVQEDVIKRFIQNELFEEVTQGACDFVVEDYKSMLENKGYYNVIISYEIGFSQSDYVKIENADIDINKVFDAFCAVYPMLESDTRFEAIKHLILNDTKVCFSDSAYIDNESYVYPERVQKQFIEYIEKLEDYINGFINDVEGDLYYNLRETILEMDNRENMFNFIKQNGFYFDEYGNNITHLI